MFQVVPSYFVRWDMPVKDYDGDVSANGPKFAEHEHTLRLSVSEPDLDAFLRTLRENGIDYFTVERTVVR